MTKYYKSSVQGLHFGKVSTNLADISLFQVHILPQTQKFLFETIKINYFRL